ncbi:MAG TPA: methyltransferase domain-containing protein [Thermoanaerobaculia bacterium]|jgi:predicted SAM-dependent methyltransferase|nr:methyltransferase domain-containing protein [Thermoanaerobaculia bacterium]
MGLFRKVRLRRDQARSVARLHIGCGQQAIAGWINIDNQGLPGVDQVLDVRRGLPFADVAAIYAEHFLEHLAFDDGLAFLAECRRVLRPDGILRLSTPNLEWVLMTHYRWQGASDEERLVDCMNLNRAFHGWGHQFLYNRATLESALRAAGFAGAAFFKYGESDDPGLRGLERHETWEDTPELPHVLVVEASGVARPLPLPSAPLREFREALASK